MERSRLQNNNDVFLKFLSCLGPNGISDAGGTSAIHPYFTFGGFTFKSGSFFFIFYCQRRRGGKFISMAALTPNISFLSDLYLESTSVVSVGDILSTQLRFPFDFVSLGRKPIWHRDKANK